MSATGDLMGPGCGEQTMAVCPKWIWRELF